MADKKKKPKKKPDGRGSRPRDPNQLALWVVGRSTDADTDSGPRRHDNKIITIAYSEP